MEYFLIYLLAGVGAGILAGLFGVGGGLIIVPVLAYLFAMQGMDGSVQMHLAVGTSLATIVFTSLSSIYAHHRRGAVRWELVLRLSPGIVLGALLGAIVADWMETAELRRFFAVFETLVGVSLLLNFQGKPTRTLPKTFGLFVTGKLIGIVSSIVGIGGGTMTVPFLAWCNVPMRESVATSSAVGLPIALAGTAGFVVMGLQGSVAVDWAIGYFYAPAFIGIVLASVGFAPLGAWLAHRLPSSSLKRIFGVFLLAVGGYMFFT